MAKTTVHGGASGGPAQAASETETFLRKDGVYTEPGTADDQTVTGNLTVDGTATLEGYTQFNAGLTVFAGNVALPASGDLGFYGTTPAAKPVVTGSKASGAALASLLTGLASLGLITDSTTT